MTYTANFMKGEISYLLFQSSKAALELIEKLNMLLVKVAMHIELYSSPKILVITATSQWDFLWWVKLLLTICGTNLVPAIGAL